LMFIYNIFLLTVYFKFVDETLRIKIYILFILFLNK
jgi:hypothetical protein